MVSIARNYLQNCLALRPTYGPLLEHNGVRKPYEISLETISARISSWGIRQVRIQQIMVMGRTTRVENTQNTNLACFRNKTVNETQLVRLSLNTQEKF